MIDLLDIFAGKYFKIFSGTYYEKYPTSPEDVGVPFDYEIVDPTEWHYQKLLQNVVVKDGATATIKSNDPLPFLANSFVVLQDGRMYLILETVQDSQSASREAFRFLADVAGVDYVLRLQEYSNARGLK